MAQIKTLVLPGQGDQSHLAQVGIQLLDIVRGDWDVASELKTDMVYKCLKRAADINLVDPEKPDLFDHRVEHGPFVLIGYSIKSKRKEYVWTCQHSPATLTALRGDEGCWSLTLDIPQAMDNGQATVEETALLLAFLLHSQTPLAHFSDPLPGPEDRNFWASIEACFDYLNRLVANFDHKNWNLVDLTRIYSQARLLFGDRIKLP